MAKKDSRKEWFVSDLTSEMQRKMCQLTRQYHKSEKELTNYHESDGKSGEGIYLTREQLREIGLSFCNVDGTLTMIEGENWSTDPMSSTPIHCPPQQDYPKKDPHELVIGFHTHPYGEPIPSRNDIVHLYEEPTEQISCVGGGNNDEKKVYCYEKVWKAKHSDGFLGLKYIDYLNLKYKHSKKILRDVINNEMFSVAFDNKFYPFDVWSDEIGEHINELTSKDVIDIYVSDDYNKHFETLPDKTERFSSIAKKRVLKEENVVKVHEFKCDDNNEFTAHRDNSLDVSESRMFEQEILNLV